LIVSQRGSSLLLRLCPSGCLRLASSAAFLAVPAIQLSSVVGQLFRSGYDALAIHRRDPTTARHGDFCLLRSRPGPVHPSLDNLVKSSSPNVTILMPGLVRTPDRHSTTRRRTPGLKPSAPLSLQVAGLQEHSVVRNRHARYRTGIRSCRAPCLSTSRPPGLPVSGSMPTDAPRTHSERGRQLATAFRSPAKISACADSVTRSTFLACCFACESFRPRRPFRLPLHCQARFAPFSAASTLQTRCGIAVRFRRPRFQLRLPLRTVISLGLNASTDLAACQPTFQGCPISVRSPQPFSISRFGCGSSFPARYCPVGLRRASTSGCNSYARPPATDTRGSS